MIDIFDDKIHDELIKRNDHKENSTDISGVILRKILDSGELDLGVFFHGSHTPNAIIRDLGRVLEVHGYTPKTYTSPIPKTCNKFYEIIKDATTYGDMLIMTTNGFKQRLVPAQELHIGETPKILYVKADLIEIISYEKFSGWNRI